MHCFSFQPIVPSSFTTHLTRRLQCFRIGPLKLVPPASFPPSVFKQKGLRQKKQTNKHNQTLSVACGSRPGIITKSAFLREGKAKTKSPWFMACFQSLRRVATQTRQRVLGLRQRLLQSVPQGLTVPPSFSNHFYFK